MGWGWVGKGSGRLGVGVGSQRAAMRAFRDWRGQVWGVVKGALGLSCR